MADHTAWYKIDMVFLAQMDPSTPKRFARTFPFMGVNLNLKASQGHFGIAETGTLKAGSQCKVSIPNRRMQRERL